MANRYVRSAFWFCSFTGLGYGLLILTSPSQTDLKKLKEELPGVEKVPGGIISKNQQFMNVLQAATENKKPLYRMSKSEIDKELK